MSLFGSDVKTEKTVDPACAVKVSETKDIKGGKQTIEVCGTANGNVESIRVINTGEKGTILENVKAGATGQAPTTNSMSSQSFANSDQTLTSDVLKSLLAGQKDLLAGLKKAGIDGHLDSANNGKITMLAEVPRTPMAQGAAAVAAR